MTSSSHKTCSALVIESNMGNLFTPKEYDFDEDLLEWAKNADLDRNTLNVLGKEGFTTLKSLDNLKLEDVITYFYKPGYLKLAPCLALQIELIKLKKKSFTAQEIIELFGKFAPAALTAVQLIMTIRGLK